MNSETVNPMPAERGGAPDLAAGHTGRQHADSGAQPARIAPPTPISFPSTSPTTTAQVMRLDAAADSTPPPRYDARVGQREQRHDDEAGERVQPVLELLEDGRPPTRPAGVSSPSTTPATVAWTPDSSIATHTAPRPARRRRRA